MGNSAYFKRLADQAGKLDERGSGRYVLRFGPGKHDLFRTTEANLNRLRSGYRPISIDGKIHVPRSRIFGQPDPSL